MLVLSCIFLIPVVLSLPQSVPPCIKCIGCPRKGSNRILIPNHDDVEIDKYPQVRGMSDESGQTFDPRYAVVPDKDGNLALVNIEQQRPIAKQALGSMDRYDGYILQNTDIPLKNALQISNAENRFKYLFKNPRTKHRESSVSNTKQSQDKAGDGWGELATSWG